MGYDKHHRNGGDIMRGSNLARNVKIPVTASERSEALDERSHSHFHRHCHDPLVSKLANGSDTLTNMRTEID